MFKKFLIFLILFFSLSFSVLAKNSFDVRLDLSTDTVELGQSFQLFIVFKNTGDQLKIDSLDMPGLENFAKVGTSRSSKIQIVNGKTSAITEISFTLIPKKTGNFKIGPLEFGNQTQKISSNIVELKVVNKQNTFFKKSISANKKITKKTSNGFAYGQWFLNVSAFLLLLYLVYGLYKQKTKQKEKILLKKQEFLAKEDEKRKKLPKIDDENFYTKIKDLFYDCLIEEYNIDVRSLTSAELLELLKNKHIPVFSEVKEFLKIYDRARFAGEEKNKNNLLKLFSKICK